METATPPTRLFTITIVIIRLFSLRLGLDGLISLISVIARYHIDKSPLLLFFASGVVLLCGYWLWQCAPFLSRHITRGHDLTLDIANLTLSDLYAFAFLLVGLYFSVDSLGPSMTWFHYSVIHSSSTAALSAQDQGNYYILFKYLIKLIIGIALIVNGRKFSNRLIKYQNKEASSVSP